jgi:hypothetical protein
MGGRRRVVAWVAAAVAALVLGGAITYAATTGLTPKSRFSHWLGSQPQVASVDQLFPPTKPDGDVRRPTAEVTTREPLTLERVESFMAALERYAAEHAEATSYTVQLHHGPDHVFATGERTGNAEVLAALHALRALPDLYAVDIGIDPYPAHVTAVLATGSDLVAAASTLARSDAVSVLRSPTWRDAGLTVRGEGLPHTVTVHGGLAPSARAAQAFAVATRLEGRSPVQLVVRPRGSDGTWTDLLLTERSPTAPTTRSAVNALGFGMPQHFERVPGGPYPDHDAHFDTAAWRRAALPAIEAVAGVRAAALSDPNTSERAVLDVRVTDAGVLDRLASVVPEAVDVVAAHTAPRAPDYDRKAALPVDPETNCPAGAGGSLNAAYTGPPSALPKAAAYLTALRATPGVSCLHWWEPGPAHTFQGQQLDVRVPLQSRSWVPVLDAVLAQRRNPGAGHPAVGVILVPRDRPWTALLLLHAGQDQPYPTTLAADSVRDFHEATDAQEPLVDYWNAALARP